MNKIFENKFSVEKFGTSASVFVHVPCKIDNSEIQPIFGYATAEDNIHETRDKGLHP